MNTRQRISHTVFVAFAAGSCLATAQTLDTAILGVVTDPSGAVVTSAAVTIEQPATGLTRKVLTNSEGAYEVRYLLPGEYNVEVSAPGFTTERRTSVVLQTGQQARLNFPMQVGQVTERTNVVAEVPLLQTENAALGEVVSTERVSNLPLNGRRFIDLAALTPGVTVRTEDQFSLVRANGTRDTTMALTFDGVKATANRWAFVAIFPPLDAIQEFKVQTGNYSAEYGGNGGANVNVQLRSGTNSFHGSAYEFLRNDTLDARNYFSPAPLPKDSLRRNQFGAVVSGRIIRDKAFFTLGWESQRNNQQSAGSDIVLTPAQRQGDFSNLSDPIIDPFTGNPFPGNIIPTNRLDPVSVSLADKFLPLPNRSGDLNYAFLSRANTNWDQGLTRVDYRLSERDQLSAHYMAQNWHFEHRFARGLSFTTAYNWSHMIDDQEDETNGERCRCQDPRHRGINEKASSILDIRQRLVVGYVWELPFTANLKGVSQAVLGGWALGGIITVQSGSPFRIYQSADTQNNDSVNSARPNLVSGQNPSLPSSERDPTHWFNTDAFTPSILSYGNTPRNPLVGPGLNTWNLSAHKAFKMPWLEGHQLEFRGELFNAFNKPQFANPGRALGTGSFGQVTSTRADNRQIQFGLRYES